MQQTPNYALKKLDLTDSPPDITVQNPNWDTIDTELKKNADQIGILSGQEASSFYVRSDVGNDNNNGLTWNTAFKTISKAINTLKKRLNGNVNIFVGPGTYNEDVVVFGFTGNGRLIINAYDGSTVVSAISSLYKINRFYVEGNSNAQITIQGIDIIYTGIFPGIEMLRNSASIWIAYCKDSVAVARDGISSNVFTNCEISNCQISNKNIAVLGYGGSRIVVGDTTGTNNSVGLRAAYASIIQKRNATVPAGTLTQDKYEGSLIVSANGTLE